MRELPYLAGDAGVIFYFLRDGGPTGPNLRFPECSFAAWQGGTDSRFDRLSLYRSRFFGTQVYYAVNRP